MEALIYGGRGPELDEYTIKGKFLRNYKIPLKMVKKFKIPSNLNDLGITREDYLSVDGRPAIKTEDGIFLIYPEKNYRDQDNITYYISEYKLKAWYPIEE